MIAAVVVTSCGGSKAGVMSRVDSSAVRATITRLSPVLGQLNLKFAGASTRGIDGGGPTDPLGGDNPIGADGSVPDGTPIESSGYLGGGYGVWYRGFTGATSGNVTLYADAGFAMPVGTESYSEGPTVPGQNYPIGGYWDLNITSGPTAQHLVHTWQVDDADGLNSFNNSQFTAPDGTTYSLWITTTDGITSVIQKTVIPAQPPFEALVLEPDPNNDRKVTFNQQGGLSGSFLVHTDSTAEGNFDLSSGEKFADIKWDRTGNATVTYANGQIDTFNVADLVTVKTSN